MGYYADGSYSFTFQDEAGIVAAAAALRLDEPEDGITRTPDEAREVIAEAAYRVGENSEASWDNPEEGVSLTIAGWSGSKFYTDNWDDFVGALAAHAEGTGDWRGEDDFYWRHRLLGDGTVKEYRGEVRYPDDPMDK